MSGYRFDVGQRVDAHLVGPAVVTYRYRDMGNRIVYVIRHDGQELERLEVEGNLSPAPLRRGDVVQREQADAIPEGTTVLCGCGNKKCLRQRFSDDEWARFGKPLSIQTDDMIWPVTIVDVPGGDES